MTGIKSAFLGRLSFSIGRQRYFPALFSLIMVSMLASCSVGGGGGDEGGLAAEAPTLTLNQPPPLAAIGGKAIAEGETLSLSSVFRTVKGHKRKRSPQARIMADLFRENKRERHCEIMTPGLMIAASLTIWGRFQMTPPWRNSCASAQPLASRSLLPRLLLLSLRYSSVPGGIDTTSVVPAFRPGFRPTISLRRESGGMSMVYPIFRYVVTLFLNMAMQRPRLAST